jgi:hypothetical protein
MSRTLRPLLLILAVALGMPVHAQDEDSEASSQREDAGDRVREVERDGGRVLQAEPMQRSGREVYRLKVLTPEGRVRVLHDSQGREPRQESFERRRFGRGDAPAAVPMPSERRYRQAESRGDTPAPERSDNPGRENGRGDDGRSRSPDY